MKAKLFRLILAALTLGSAVPAQATIVEVTTNLGKFEINLYDQSTPITVQNFLNYVNSGRYDGTVFHRSVPGFVIQGGGYRFQQQLPLVATATNPAIVNEPVWSNVRATVAMAKSPGNPNSATNQWYINLANNSANLNAQNGGFTVFGQISSADMAVVDAIAALPRFSFNNQAELPLVNYTNTDRDDNVPLVAENLVTIESIVVVDARANTVSGLTQVPNNTPEPDNGLISAGTFGFFWLFITVFAIRRRTP
ncbi:MAG TPA: peptidylprolyl isomerase [Rheinheimera sp.]|nr:peptidylprolyl isomerase [Rheinheimera sp.]